MMKGVVTPARQGHSAPCGQKKPSGAKAGGFCFFVCVVDLGGGSGGSGVCVKLPYDGGEWGMSMYSNMCCDSLRTNFKRTASSFLWIPGIKVRTSSVVATAFLDGPLYWFLQCVWLPFRDCPPVMG